MELSLVPMFSARAAQHFCALTWKPEAYSSVYPLPQAHCCSVCAPSRRSSKAARAALRRRARGVRTVCSERGLSHWSSFLPWPIPSTHSVPTSTNSAQPSHAKAEAAVGRCTLCPKIQNFVQKILGLFSSYISETCKYGASSSLKLPFGQWEVVFMAAIRNDVKFK